ncbi:MAG: NUDIX domain-containing protein [bacterium]|nr:NUDIX domain-containing protein [bacterium]
MLYDDIVKFVAMGVCQAEAGKEFLSRAKSGLLTRDENPATHFCVYFLPFNKAEKKFFIIHHKKSGLWLSPGGHINKGENAWQAVNREINEELGMKNFFKIEPNPFLLTITPIEKDVRSCKAHYDIWYLVETDGSNFNLDPTEFFSAK